MELYLCVQIKLKKTSTMKKVFAILAVAGFFAACNSGETSETPAADTTATVAPAADTTAAAADTTAKADTTAPAAH